MIGRAMSVHGASAHWYEKEGVSLNRKIGHVTVVAPDMTTARLKMSKITLMKDEAVYDASCSKPSTTEVQYDLFLSLLNTFIHFVSGGNHYGERFRSASHVCCCGDAGVLWRGCGSYSGICAQNPRSYVYICP